MQSIWARRTILAFWVQSGRAAASATDYKSQWPRRRRQIWFSECHCRADGSGGGGVDCAHAVVFVGVGPPAHGHAAAAALLLLFHCREPTDLTYLARTPVRSGRQSVSQVHLSAAESGEVGALDDRGRNARSRRGDEPVWPMTTTAATATWPDRSRKS